MMTPEDVLIESIQIASMEGDSAELRREACAKLAESMKVYYNIVYATDNGGNGSEAA
jgi:hypothetical protein